MYLNVELFSVSQNNSKFLCFFSPSCLQMEKVEEDLIRSKSLREKQAKEFSLQLDALRQKYEQQVCISL